MATSCDVREKTLLTSPTAPVSRLSRYAGFILSKVHQRFTVPDAEDEVSSSKLSIHGCGRVGKKTSSQEQTPQMVQINLGSQSGSTSCGLHSSQCSPSALTISKMKRHLIRSLGEFNDRMRIRCVAWHGTSVSSKQIQ